MRASETKIKNVEKYLGKSITSAEYYNAEEFIEDAGRYVKAIEDGRVICSIGSVSRSGMSRTIKFLECHKGKHPGKPSYRYLNFYAFMLALGFSKARSLEDYFSISGCGMDMIFHTNYTIMHKLERMGLISKAKCSHLAQHTPTVI